VIVAYSKTLPWWWRGPYVLHFRQEPLACGVAVLRPLQRQWFELPGQPRQGAHEVFTNTFAALADPTRRAILQGLASGEKLVAAPVIRRATQPRVVALNPARAPSYYIGVGWLYAPHPRVDLRPRGVWHMRRGRGKCYSSQPESIRHGQSGTLVAGTWRQQPALVAHYNSSNGRGDHPNGQAARQGGGQATQACRYRGISDRHQATKPAS
jgi:hypothetical protein